MKIGGYIGDFVKKNISLRRKTAVHLSIGLWQAMCLCMQYVIAILKHMHSGNPLNTTSLFVQAACIVVFMVVLCNSTKISNNNNAMEEIAEGNNNNAENIERQTVMTGSLRRLWIRALRREKRRQVLRNSWLSWYIP